MKRMIINRAIFAFTAGFVTAVTAYALPLPEVSNVVMQQREGSRIVDITYDLSGVAAIVTLGVETNGIALPDNAVTHLTGDVSVVIQPGTGRHIVWNAGFDWPENLAQDAQAKVTAWAIETPPLYCAVDVVGGLAAEVYPIYYYTSAEAVPEGVTNDLYKTTRILMRRIPETGATGFKMGSVDEYGRTPAQERLHHVVLTKPFYAGVYEITQSQWYQVMGDWPSKWRNIEYKKTRPVTGVSFNDIRGLSDGAGWPDNNDVDENSFIWRLRIKSGLAGFDLPTDAQWEYACRAGTPGALNNGTINLTNLNSDAQLDLVGRYANNGGRPNGETPSEDCTTASATAAVGTYLPNAWGLDDMHGNVWEWCLDWFEDDLGIVEVTDPKGATFESQPTPPLRMGRGGSWYHASAACRSAKRDYREPQVTYNDWTGFRLVRTLP